MLRRTLPACLLLVTCLGTALPGLCEPSPGELERVLLERINAHRASRRLPPLVLDERLTAAARLHSAAMASGQAPFGHSRFARSLGSAGENVAMNQGYAEPDLQAFSDWLTSPPHRRNLEGNRRLTGVGIARSEEGEYYFTQIFAPAPLLQARR